MANFGPIVVGAGRGGTSLLAALIDAHPMLEVGIETHSNVLMPSRYTTGEDDDRPPEQRMADFLRRCQLSAACSTARGWGTKITTEQLYAVTMDTDIEPLDFFSASLGDTPTIALLRDGRTCVRSKVQRTGRSYEEAVRRWRFSVEAYHHLCARGALGLTFEDLVRDPERTLRRACDFLSVPFDELMFTGTSSEQLRPEYRRSTIDPARAVVSPLPAAVIDLMHDDLVTCGYL